MIPQAHIAAWSKTVPWQTNEQVEQDLVICRALVEIFSDEFLASKLAFRGGTALHKLFLSPQPRYSEDIDLVQITAEPFGPIADRLRERLAFIGKPQVAQRDRNFTLKYRFDSEIPPIVKLRLKIETNCREHITVMGIHKIPFEVTNEWFNGKCEITTYHPEELLGTKIRAMFQRSKGRDLFDLHKALSVHVNLNVPTILECYHTYMKASVPNPPSRQEFLDNMDAKMKDDEFLGDIKALLRPEEKYDSGEAWELVRQTLIEKL
ncbi:MAG: nucleotidyl transferase AbiEii/AbiGii toxin family protein [Bacteroidia bacterium]|nr:nucleotidyl transferase AbiEii/AbiGii toxin family protein [Bacteroidia bacterium]